MTKNEEIKQKLSLIFEVLDYEELKLIQNTMNEAFAMLNELDLKTEKDKLLQRYFDISQEMNEKLTYPKFLSSGKWDKLLQEKLQLIKQIGEME